LKLIAVSLFALDITGQSRQQNDRGTFGYKRSFTTTFGRHEAADKAIDGTGCQ
jgi:hypothetical protein